MSESKKVYQVINAIQAALAKAGITKDRKNQKQGYAFRGIDDVYNTLAPLLAEHGLCILPRMMTRTSEWRETKNGTDMNYVSVEAEFDFVCAEDCSSHTVKTFGEAMDSADKATNKAMSAAYKYAAFQAFSIPTEGDNDADAHTPPPTAKAFPAQALSSTIKAINEAKTMKEAVSAAEAFQAEHGTVADAELRAALEAKKARRVAQLQEESTKE